MAVMAQRHKVRQLIIMAVSVNMVNRKLARVENCGCTLSLLTESLFKLAIGSLVFVYRFPMAVLTAVMLNPITNLIFKDFDQSFTDRAISQH